ncbi:MAG: AAA family ATPase [Omnitrophica WOR_2 bacterium]
MITEVEMINWRAFEKQKFTFKPGLNFIMGQNGRGKTSILEAISYGLTGEPSVVNDRDELLRDPEKPATVKLSFKVGEKVYVVVRTQQPGRAGEAHIYDALSKKSLASSHKGVTEKVEELTGVSADFLQRIIYMAEGDVFRFLKNPPGKAMNQQVQQVLGLTQLDQLQEGIKLAEKELKNDTKELKTLQQRIENLDIAASQTLDGMIGYLDSKRNSLMAQVLGLQDDLTRSKGQSEALIALGENIERNIPQLRVNPNIWQHVQQMSLSSLLDYAENDVQRQINEIQLWEKDLSALAERKENCRRILDLLSVTGREEEDVACPVCKKPMTHSERLEVIKETDSLIRSIEADADTLLAKRSGSKGALNQAQKSLGGLLEIHNSIIHGRTTDISPQMPIGEMRVVLDRSREQSRQLELKKNIEAITRQVDDLEKARANFISVHNQLQERGFTSPGDILEALIQIETRLLTLTAARVAVEATLADMRDGRLGSIYEQITAVWNNFIQHGQWHVRFDPEGSPLLAEESEREFSFSQFSGGEKTSLLVIIHTVIAHHFSKCKFLLVDEPLEHLDSINRRSLMRFFMAASQNKFIDQALITTYEESLVRKYISEENVNVIYIR